MANHIPTAEEMNAETNRFLQSKQAYMDKIVGWITNSARSGQFEHRVFVDKHNTFKNLEWACEQLRQKGYRCEINYKEEPYHALIQWLTEYPTPPSEEPNEDNHFCITK